MRTILMILLIAGSLPGFANEPLWTAEERAERRQCVVTARVRAIERVNVDPKYENVYLMRASLEVKTVEKGKIVGDAPLISVYYETSPLGARYRCPSFAVLKVGDTARFYLRHDAGLTKEKQFVIEMGSDVEPTKPNKSE